jgi:hypothetical protein
MPTVFVCRKDVRMSFSKALHLLLIWMVACAGGLSCKSSGSQAVEEKGRLQNEKRVLSKQEIIDIANAAGRQYERDPEKWVADIDEGNAEWREWAVHLLYQPSFEENPRPNNELDAEILKQWPAARRGVWPEVKDDELDAAIVKRWPMLKAHDYQVLWYADRSPGPHVGLDMGRMIMVDKNTGEILVALGQWGEVLKPKSEETRPN